MAIDPSGSYMASAGLDNLVKLWDLRNTFAPMHSYQTVRPASSLAFSQRGLLGVGCGPHVQIWSKEAVQHKVQRPYLRHIIPGQIINNLTFCPYEDALGIGHTKGFSSCLVPGSGEPNFDTYEANPYATTKQKEEHEVHQLLQKIQPDMISLDSHLIGSLDPRSAEQRNADAQASTIQAENEAAEKMTPKQRERYLKKLKIADSPTFAMLALMPSVPDLRNSNSKHYLAKSLLHHLHLHLLPFFLDLKNLKKK